jgi:hypothetical protein
MDLTRLVSDVGDRVSGWAEISEDDDGIWLNPLTRFRWPRFGGAPHAVPVLQSGCSRGPESGHTQRHDRET